MFKYHLTIACRIVEYAFGINSIKWHFLHASIILNMQNVKSVCALHDFVHQCDRFLFEDSLIHNMERVHWTGPPGSRQGTHIRDEFISYFMYPIGQLEAIDLFYILKNVYIRTLVLLFFFFYLSFVV